MRSSFDNGGRVRVAFFQRIFAHYQAGLVRELADHSPHAYRFFGDLSDPLATGIEPIGEELRSRVPFEPCRTVCCGSYLALQWRAVREALLGDFDVFILEGSYLIATNWLAIPLARLRGKRVLLYTHGWLRRESGALGGVRNAFYRMSHGLLLYGKRSREIGIELGFAPDRLQVVHNSLDLEPIDLCRASLSEEGCRAFREEWFPGRGDLPLVVSVGRLTRAKDYPLLIDAAAELRRQGVELNLMLVGGGPDRDLLRDKAEQLGVRLALPGSRYAEEFLGLCFAAAAATVIPGAAGLTVIHSLSYGTPVVVHDSFEAQMPEAEAVVQGENGWHFTRGDCRSLAESIGLVLQRLPRSPEVEQSCRAGIDAFYNPRAMRHSFDEAVHAAS